MLLTSLYLVVKLKANVWVKGNDNASAMKCDLLKYIFDRLILRRFDYFV